MTTKNYPDSLKEKTIDGYEIEVWIWKSGKTVVLVPSLWSNRHRVETTREEALTLIDQIPVMTLSEVQDWQGYKWFEQK